MSLSHDTKVFIVAHHAGNKYWLISAANQKDARTGRLVLQGQWGSPAEAKSTTLELATVYRRRFLEETHAEVHFTMAAGDSQYVEEPNSSTTQGEDTRVPMAYRGLLARPGINTRSGIRCWYVKVFDGPSQLESISSSSPEAVVDRVFEMNLQEKAEKAPAPVAPAPVQPKYTGPVVRPGDRGRR
jgi:hypothetical protein